MRTIKITWEPSFNFEATVEVDGDKGEKACLETVAFFADGPRVLRQEDGDAVRAFCYFLAPMLFEQCKHDPDAKHAIETMKKVEGFYPLDGSAGIKLTLFEPFETLDGGDFEYEEGK